MTCTHPLSSRPCLCRGCRSRPRQELYRVKSAESPAGGTWSIGMGAMGKPFPYGKASSITYPGLGVALFPFPLARGSLLSGAIRLTPSGDLALQAFQEFFSGFREKLVFFPRDMEPHLQLRLQRPEAQRAVAGCSDDLVQAQGVPHAFLHHDRGVVQQIVCRDDVQLLIAFPEPS